MRGLVSRPLRIALIASAVALFVVASFLVARVLGAANAERNAAVELIKAENAGDREGVVDRIRGCRADAACVARIRALVPRLRSRQRARVLRVDGPGNRLALGERAGTTRIVWKAGTRLPTVQCLRLRRRGDVLGGFHIDVVSVSGPIGREASCARRPAP